MERKIAEKSKEEGDDWLSWQHGLAAWLRCRRALLLVQRKESTGAVGKHPAHGMGLAS
jgi:hypothetical protein